jgi:hypothetical protein
VESYASVSTTSSGRDNKRGGCQKSVTCTVIMFFIEKNAFRAASARISMAECARDPFLAENFPADVRPEFLEDVIQDSGFHLRSKVQSRLTQVAFLGRIISGGQTRFQCISALPATSEKSKLVPPESVLVTNARDIA